MGVLLINATKFRASLQLFDVIIYWSNPPEKPAVFSLDTADAQFELQAAHIFNKINFQFVLLFLPTVSLKGLKFSYFTGD